MAESRQRRSGFRGIAVACVLAFAAGLGVGRWVLPRAGTTGPEPPAPLGAAGVVDDTDDGTPAPPGCTAAPGVRVLWNQRPPAIEDDEGLRARVARFQRPAVVEMAQHYADPGPDHGPIDVFMVQRDGVSGLELHWIEWYGDGTGMKRDEVGSFGLASCNGLLLLDVDGDGSREVITVTAGCLDVFDFQKPRAERRRGGSLWRALCWRFADVDGDGTQECAAVITPQVYEKAWGTPPDPAVSRWYKLYRWRDKGYELDAVYDHDPFGGDASSLEGARRPWEDSSHGQVN